MATLDNNVKCAQDWVEEALCEENSHVVLWWRKRWREVTGYAVPFTSTIDYIVGRIPEDQGEVVKVVTLSEELEPQMKEVKKKLKKLCV